MSAKSYYTKPVTGCKRSRLF